MPSAERRVRVRTYDPARCRAALVAQARALLTLVHQLCARTDAEAVLAAPTRLGDWTVRSLLAHLGSAFDAITDNLGLPTEDGPVLTPIDWVAATRTAAPAIADLAQQRAAEAFGGAPAEVAAALDDAVERALKALDQDYSPLLRVPNRFGPMLFGDYLVTRLVETVVHADDLAAALARACPELCPDPDAFPHDRQALAAVTRLLADALAVQAPGGAVELRIPPFAVVQCVPGPRHTRGTPPNVVETSPLAWIRLATGRLSWAEATGRLGWAAVPGPNGNTGTGNTGTGNMGTGSTGNGSTGNVAQLTASGERSDLSALLPVMG